LSNTQSPKKHLIRGAIWTVGTRWLIKALGFINTVVMARLLLPADYGIVAMGMLTVGLIQTFLDFSATVALLRKSEVSREEIDSAWTLRLIQGCAAGTIIFLCAPLAVNYFGEPRLNEVLWTFAACVVLASGSNVAETLALKNFDYTLTFKIQTLGKLSSVIATIGFGLWLRDYRALTIGIATGYLVPLVLSYHFHPYRPRWNTQKISEIWRITKWLLVSNIGGFLMRKCDELIAGRIGSTAQFGLYNVGSDLGQLPVAEVGPAMQRAILPVLASIKEDADRTRQAVLKTLSAVNTVIWPLGLGFAAVAFEATDLLLGEKWHMASPYVAIFSITAAIQASGGPLRAYLTLLGYTKVQSTITWIEFFCFAVLAAVLVPYHHLLGLAYARMLGSIVNFICLTISTHLYCNLPFTKIINSTYRSIGTAAIMALIVMSAFTSVASPILRLTLCILGGAALYTSAIFLSWQLAGKPEGFESTIYDKFIKLRK